MENQNKVNNAALKKMIQAKKQSTYIPEAQSTVPDSNALGLIVCQYFDYDGLAVLKMAYSALEDMNWHEENRTIEAMIKKLEGKGV